MSLSSFFAGCVVGLALLLPYGVSAQSVQEADWSQGLSSYQRFVVYPHLEKAFRDMEEGDVKSAVAQFSQAHALAKQQPQIALYLANALEKDQQFNQALELLSNLQAQYPKRQDIQLALTQVKTKLAQATLEQAQQLAADPKQLQGFMAKQKPEFTQAYDEHRWISLLTQSQNGNKSLLRAYRPQFKQNEIFQIEEVIKALIASGNQKSITQYIDQISQAISSKPNELDQFSYQLVEQGAADQAIQLLLNAYPFENTDERVREALIDRLALAQSKATDKAALIRFLQNKKPNLSTAEREREWLEMLAAASNQDAKLLTNYSCKYEENKAIQAELVLNRFESSPGKIAANQVLRFLPHLEKLQPAQLDQISYQLDKEGLKSQSLKLLLDAYPYQHASPEQRNILFDRLSNLSASQAKELTQHDIARLSTPLDTVEYRSRQSELLDALKNCVGVERVLEDYSPSYDADDWLRLGNCYQKDPKPGLAQYAYTQAYDRDANVHTARVLAYQAFETKDYQTSLKMWKILLQSDRYTTADLMAAAYTAVSSDELKLAAQWLDAYADKGGFQSDQYWWLKTVTEQKSKPQQALSDIKRAIALKPKVEYFEMLAALQTKLGQEPAAIEALEKALALNTENSSVQASLGYAYYRQEKMDKAKIYLDQAHKMRPDDNRLIEQLAYVNQRLGRNDEALVYTERAIDQDDLYTPEEMTPEIEKQRFGLRRMHEDLSRRWSFSADAISGNQLAAVPNAPQPGLNYKSYAQAEVAYRLGNPAIDDGKTLSAYSRIFAGNGPSGSAIPMYAPVLAAGLRWKPFSSQVINFAVEQQVPLDQGQSPSANTLLRVSASFFNSGKYSDEWHPAAQGWLAQNLYLDAAYYVVNRLSSLTADYRLSYHNKIGESQTLEPYSHIQWNSLNQQTQADIRAGFGVRWNIWSNESHYNAYATKISVGLEFQYAISSYLSDKSTALLTLGGRW